MLAGCWYPFFSGPASLRQQVTFEMRLEDMSASAHKGMGDCAHNNMLSLCAGSKHSFRQREQMAIDMNVVC